MSLARWLRSSTWWFLTRLRAFGSHLDETTVPDFCLPAQSFPQLSSKCEKREAYVWMMVLILNENIGFFQFLDMQQVQGPSAQEQKIREQKGDSS